MYRMGETVTLEHAHRESLKEFEGEQGEVTSWERDMLGRILYEVRFGLGSLRVLPEQLKKS